MVDALELRLQLLPLERVPYGCPDPLADAGGGLVRRVLGRVGPGLQGLVPAGVDRAAVPDPFGIAAENTFRAELAGLDVRDHIAAGVRLRMMAVDGNPLVTTAALWPDVTARMAGVADALVCLPRFCTVLVRPVLTTGDIGCARTLWSVAQAVAADAPDPCSDGVYWWHAGRLFRIDIEDSVPVLPAELRPVVGALPEAEPTP